MKEKLTKNYYYLKFIFFLRFFADSMFYSYTALYLASIGLKEGMIGSITSITTITCLIVNPIWSIVAKNNKVSRFLLFILTIIEGVLIIIYGNMDLPSLIMVLTCLLAVSSGPYYNLLDGYASSICEKTGKKYSNIRVMGSIAYLVGVPISGILIGTIGFTWVFCISGIIFILTGISSLLLRKQSDIENKNEKKRDYFGIIKNKSFIFYVIFYILVITVSTVTDSYVSIIYTQVKGLTTTEYSFVNALILVFETVFLLISGKLFSKTKDIYLILIFGLCFFLKVFVISFTDLPLYILIPFSCLRGVAYGVFLFFHIRYLIKLVGVENVTTAAIILSVLSSLFQFTLNNTVGYIIEIMGYGFTYKILSFVILGAIIVYSFILCLKKPKICEKTM